MAKKIIKAQMKQRRDTLENWAAANPVLLDGELGFIEGFNDRFKVGDGKTAWNDLSYFSGSFDPSGTYPDLTAGDLAGRGESVPASFGFRASGGKSIKDGRAYIKRIKGNSVVWNQKVEKTYIDGDKVLENIDVIPQNHKFALIRSKAFGGCYYLPSVDVYNYALTDGEYAKIFVQSHVVDAEYSRIYSTGESGYIQLIDLTKMFQAGNEPTTIEEFNARVATLGIDLNAYNEGEVIHCNTESIKSVGDNAWDEEWRQGFYVGSGVYIESPTQICSKNPIPVLPNATYYINQEQYYVWYYDKEMQYIGFDAKFNSDAFITPSNAAYIHFNLEPPYGVTYNHDICIRLAHTGYKTDYEPYWQDTLPLPIIRKYFPDGMKKAGTAHDEIRFNKASGKWEAVQRVTSLDLGTLDWLSVTSGHFYVQDVLGDIGYGNLICAKYSTGMGRFSDMAADKVIGNNPESPYNSAIFVRDDAYTDVESFKAALQGVILYYESNNWEWVELDAEDQNFRDYYQVADFGTEMSQSKVPSAAFSADIIYQFNAVDMIREHEMEINELQSVIATMQAQLTSLINK